MTSATQSIKYLPLASIDRDKWDACISQAPNGLIYGFSFYLDQMSRHWDALVLGDYEAVMPLTCNRKYGINYLYQPFLAAQLGIFGKNLREKDTSDFLAAIPRKFRFWDICLNNGNGLTDARYNPRQRINYVLDLGGSYENIRGAYRENTIRNIRRAEQAACRFEKHIDPELVIALALQQMQQQGQHPGANIERFRKLLGILEAKHMAKAFGVFSGSGKLLSSCIFFFSHQRAYYILVGNDPEGKTTGSSHFLIDRFIHEHAGQRLLLDFEGSDIPSLAHFYSGFGAEIEMYPALRVNRLPWLVKWLVG